MSYELIKVNEKFSGQVCEIILNTPPANILTAKMMSEISQQLSLEATNHNRKLLVFTGQGQNFCYGASVEEHLPEKVHIMLPAFHGLIGQVLSLPVPTLAKVTGLCLGGGFELTLACSFIFADETAKFAVPEILLGVFPPVAASLLPFQCANSVATKLILSGDKASAKDLFNMGLVNYVAMPENLDADLSTFIEKHLLPKSASSLRIAHQASRMAIAEHYQQSIEKLEQLYLQDLMKTHDAIEGIRAFVEKRPPQWTNN